MTAAIPPLRFDPLGLFTRVSGLSAELLEFVYPQLEAARQSLLAAEAPVDDEGGATPTVSAADVVAEPDRLIADYRAHRERSELGRMLATARRLAETVDRVVVVANHATLLALRALIEACSHPYYNELSRAERGGQPRMYFAGDSLDNDALAGLLDLVHQDGHTSGPQGSWGLILIDDGYESAAVSAARTALLAALKSATASDPREIGRRCVLIAQGNSRWDDFLRESACDRFELAAGAGGLRSVFDAAGLLPAAALGIDVRRLLEGAARLNSHFRDRPAAENVVLTFVGACHLLRDQNRPWLPALATWGEGLRSLLRWHDELPTLLRAPAIVPVARKSQAERTFPLNLLVDEVRRDRLPVGGEPHRGALELLPDVLAAKAQEEQQRAADARRPWAALHVPRLDAPCIGQLFQMFLVATLLARRLPTVTQSSHASVPSPNH